MYQCIKAVKLDLMYNDDIVCAVNYVIYCCTIKRRLDKAA